MKKHQYQPECYGVVVPRPDRIPLKDAIPLMQPSRQKEMHRLFRGVIKSRELVLNLPRSRTGIGSYYIMPTRANNWTEDRKLGFSETLYTPTHGAIAFVFVTNGTPEPKGKEKGLYRNYLLRAPLLEPHGTIESAIAWGYGITRFGVNFEKLQRT